MRDLRLEPGRTVLVEDMTQGITLGNAVGPATVGKPSVLEQDLSSADFVVDDIRDVLKMVNGAAPGRRPGTGVSREYREVYERRERDKSAGRIARLPDLYHSENLSFVRYVHRAVAASVTGTRRRCRLRELLPRGGHNRRSLPSGAYRPDTGGPETEVRAVRHNLRPGVDPGGSVAAAPE